MTDYPLFFKVSSEAGKDDHWKSDSDGEVEVGIKPEFGGGYEKMAPENLYAHSLANCYIATFKVIARNSSLEYERISLDGELKMENTDKGILLTDFKAQIVLEGVEKESLADRVLEKTSRSCPVLNSVDTEKEFSFRIN